MAPAAPCLLAASLSRRPAAQNRRIGRGQPVIPPVVCLLTLIAAFFGTNSPLAAAYERRLGVGKASLPGARRPVLAHFVGRHSNGTAAPSVASAPFTVPFNSLAAGRKGLLLVDETSTTAVGAQGLASAAAGSFDSNKVTEEVTRPIERPSGATPCIVPIMTERSFSQFFDPVTVTYSPPSGCPGPWQLVVVAMSARLNGRNFDRRFTFSLGGIPLLVATTAQYRTPGMNFSSERDLTLYSSLLSQAQTGVIELPNPTDSTYTGVYTVSVELQFYPGTPAQALPDVVIPAPKASFTAPRNVYQAKVEIYVSHFQSDEFYYFCVPGSYYRSLSQADQQYLGDSGLSCNTTAFREVVVSLDGTPVGVVFPKPILYSGALDPLAWRGFMGIGSLFMPTYTLDVTPFVGRLLDGRAHRLTVEVRFASKDSLWIAAGALLLWRDPVLSQTRAGLVQTSRFSGPNLNEAVSDFKSLNTQIRTTASRQFYSSGVVTSSFGTITTTVTSAFSFNNRLVFGRSLQTILVDHLSTTTSTVQSSKSGAGVLSTERTTFQFPFEIASDFIIPLSFPQDIITGFTYNLIIRFNHAVLSDQSVTTPNSQQSVYLSNNQGISTLLSADASTGSIYDYLLSGTHNYDLVGTTGCYARIVETVVNPSAYGSLFPEVVAGGEVTSCQS